MNNLKYGPQIPFLPFTGENEFVLCKYGGMECGIWLYHAYNKC